MKRTFFLLILLITICSCQDNKKLNQIQSENEMLKKQLEGTKKQESSEKFVWIVINYTYGTYYSETDRLGDLKKSIIFSDIIEINNYDDSMKYRLEDELEKDLRNRYKGLLHSIQERKTYVFGTYKEASQFKFQTLNR
jgi:hypothetical protein